MRLRGVAAIPRAGAVLGGVAALCLAACATQSRRPPPAPQPADEAVPAAAMPPPSGATPDATATRAPARTGAGPAPAAASVPTDAAVADRTADAGIAAAAPLDDGAAVFAVLRARLASRDCGDDRVVARWLAWYARAPDRLAVNLERVLPLLAHVLEQVRAAGLPGEFALLPIVESWYRPDARHAGTVGLWQFSAGTARAYGLRVDDGADQRLAAGPATEAALAHLADLLDRFGDWRLAVMAYNAGEYRLAQAHAADPADPSPEQHRPAGLSLVTYEHLAKLQALACLVLEPGRAGLELPAGRFDPPAPDVLLAAGGSGATRPADGVHEVRRGDSLWAIARRHGVDVADLLRWNALDAKAVLKPGQRIRLSP